MDEDNDVMELVEDIWWSVHWIEVAADELHFGQLHDAAEEMAQAADMIEALATDRDRWKARAEAAEASVRALSSMSLRTIVTVAGTDVGSRP